MARITAPKIAYRLDRPEDPGSDAGFHLKVMEGEDMVLMSCGAMGKRDEVVQAPIALIQTEDTCQTCFASFFSAGTKNSTQGVGMTVVLPEKAVKLCNAEGEEGGCEYHLFTISGEEGLVTSCGLMGSEEETEYFPIGEIPASELCAGCFGPFRIEDELPAAAPAAAEASVAQAAGLTEEFSEFPSLDDLISGIEASQNQEETLSTHEEPAAPQPLPPQETPAAFEEPAHEPAAAPIAPSHHESLAETLGFGSIDDLFDQIVDDATSQETKRAAESEAEAAVSAPSPETELAVEPEAEAEMDVSAQNLPPEPVAEVPQPFTPPRLEEFIAKPQEPAPIAPKAQAASQRPSPVREEPKGRGPLVWGIAAVLVLAGGAGYYLTSQKPADPAVAVENALKKSAVADSMGPSAEERKAMSDSRAREEAESKAAEEKRAKAEALKAAAERTEKTAETKAPEAGKTQKIAETAAPRNNEAHNLAAQRAKAKADEEERESREAAARARAEAAAKAKVDAEASRTRQAIEEKARAEAADAQARAKADAEASRARQAAEEKARAEEEAAARAKAAEKARAEEAEKARAEAEAAAAAKAAPKASEAPYLIHFHDKNLERCVREAAKVPESARLTEDLFRDLRVLDCQGSGIESVAGIESLLSLESVNLANNGIVDMTPLAFLPRLVSLNLKFNKITDISSITRIPSKCEINLLDNPIADIKPLLKRRKK
jgi:hypothetical protein